MVKEIIGGQYGHFEGKNVVAYSERKKLTIL